MMTSAEMMAFAPGRVGSKSGLLSALFGRFRHEYRRRRDLREARAAFMHTLYLDDRVLDDIGVTREDALWAASLPLEVNAAQALRARAAAKRGAGSF